MGCCPNILSRAAIAALLLYGQFTLIADILSRLRLPSSSPDDLLVPAVRLPTVERRAFLVAGVHTCHDLPVCVTSAPSLHTFRKRLKLHLFRLSYPGLVL